MKDYSPNRFNNYGEQGNIPSLKGIHLHSGGWHLHSAADTHLSPAAVAKLNTLCITPAYMLYSARADDNQNIPELII